MLIKYYTYDGSLIIIDNVKDIEVPSGFVSYDPIQAGDDFKDYLFDNFLDDSQLDIAIKRTRIITYSNGEGACRLIVCGTAYICNDDGKTIEKVSALD